MKKFIIAVAMVCLIGTPAFAGIGDDHSHHNGNTTTTTDSHDVSNSNSNNTYDNSGYTSTSHYQSGNTTTTNTDSHDYSSDNDGNTDVDIDDDNQNVFVNTGSYNHVQEGPKPVYNAPEAADVQVTYHGVARESGNVLSFDKFDLEMSKKLAISGSIDTFATDKEVYVEAYFKGSRDHISASRCLAAARVAAWKAGGNFETMTIEIRVTPVAYNSSFKIGGGSSAGLGIGGGSALAPSLLGGVGVAKSLYTYDIEITILTVKDHKVVKSHKSFGGGDH